MTTQPQMLAGRYTLPSNYTDLTRSPIFNTLIDQYIQIVNTSDAGTRFMDLAERLIQPETILVVASDPVQLNFAACLVEVIGLTGSPVIQQERMAQIFEASEYGVAFTGLTDATADQPGTLRFTITSSRLRLVAYGYGVIFTDRIVWCSVAGNDAFQAEISADADILFQSLTIDLDELIRTQPTPQAATAVP